MLLTPVNGGGVAPLSPVHERKMIKIASRNSSFIWINGPISSQVERKMQLWSRKPTVLNKKFFVSLLYLSNTHVALFLNVDDGVIKSTKTNEGKLRNQAIPSNVVPFG
ncbi:hypothetical protein BCR42DRAFT_397554 [Absidia repens]|uniref:Uncharacterized protein n=1 Tax=Absidia repens TaxID=90262 RepID=A0A1X2I298_9FUNG|nr:hypothetical protein BCR42DRAFT_397554 [Absidia repens]